MVALWLMGMMASRLRFGWHDSERLRGFCDRQMDRLTDICNSRVDFATENAVLDFALN